MALFQLPKVKKHEFRITADMKAVIDSKLLDASQVKKFSDFPELLEVEIDNEIAHPSIENLEKDIFDAVYTNNPNKFMRCVARVGVKKDLLERIYNWLIAKPDFNPKKDLPLLKRIEGAKSVFNIFDY